MFGQRKRERERERERGGGWSVPSLVYIELQYLFPPPWRVFEPSVIQTLWPVFVWRTRLTFGVYLITATC